MARRLKVVARDQCIGCFSCMYACSRTWHQALTVSKSALRVRAYAGVEGAFSIRVCRACDDPDCVRACPTGALSKSQKGHIKLDPDKCNGCMECVKACLIQGLQWDWETGRPIPCLQCGVCARYCPNGVIAIVEEQEGGYVEERA